MFFPNAALIASKGQTECDWEGEGNDYFMGLTLQPLSFLSVLKPDPSNVGLIFFWGLARNKISTDIDLPKTISNNEKNSFSKSFNLGTRKQAYFKKSIIIKQHFVSTEYREIQSLKGILYYRSNTFLSIIKEKHNHFLY